jgi:fumarate reductase subunit D
MQEQASTFVTAGFVVLPVAMAAVGLWAVRRAAPARLARSAALVVGWMTLWAALAGQGVLARFDLRPPPMIVLFFGSLGAGFWLGFSALGGRLAQAFALPSLVLVQGFRLPLELLMHEAAREHVMPNALSYTGYNFDIVTGASAIVVAIALRRGATARVAWLWNAYGCLCLFVIAIIALVTSPMIDLLGPDERNTWVTHFPFVWLPSVLVAFALAGHIIVFRKLRQTV